jgi:hypothetical protein
MFGQQEPVIGRQDDGGIIPPVSVVKMVKQAAKLGITQTHQRRVIGAKFSYFGLCLIDLL